MDKNDFSEFLEYFQKNLNLPQKGRNRFQLFLNMLGSCLIFDDLVYQVLEYHPEPWNQWLEVGNLEDRRVAHAVLSVGPQQLPCILGEHNDGSWKW